MSPSPGDLPNPGTEPRCPALWADSLPDEPPGKFKNTGVGSLSLLQRIFPTQELNQGLLQCRWILFQKNIYFCFIDYAKAFDCVNRSKLWKILKEMGIPDHLTCLLRNLYASQEATVRTGHGTTDWFQIGKGVRQPDSVTLLIYLLCRVHHEKRWAGRSTGWNQDCREKYQ